MSLENLYVYGIFLVKFVKYPPMKIRAVTVWENLVYSYKCLATYTKFHYNSLSYVHMHILAMQ